MKYLIENLSGNHRIKKKEILFYLCVFFIGPFKLPLHLIGLTPSPQEYSNTYPAYWLEGTGATQSLHGLCRETEF